MINVERVVTAQQKKGGLSQKQVLTTVMVHFVHTSITEKKKSDFPEQKKSDFPEQKKNKPLANSTVMGPWWLWHVT